MRIEKNSKVEQETVKRRQRLTHLANCHPPEATQKPDAKRCANAVREQVASLARINKLILDGKRPRSESS
jgi:hypothetical protein